jgi:CheY-like chemotaxis protein
MRILVADQNALLLAAITATFGPHCDLITATRRDVCIAQIEQHQFDVVIACDRLSDYTGLELLSEVSALSPGTLLVFAANAQRLSRLESQLSMFGLFETLAYPITPKKLVDVLKRARECLRAGPNEAEKPLAHVVLDSEWDTGTRLGLVETEIQARSDAAGRPEHDEWLEGPTREAVAAHSRSLGDDDVDDYVFDALPMLPAPVTPVVAEWTTVVHGALAEPEMDVTQPRSSSVSRGPEMEAHTSLTYSHDAFSENAQPGSIIDMEPLEALPTEAYAAEPSSVDEFAGETKLSKDSEDEFCTNDPVFEMPEQPQWAEDGAANDVTFVPETVPSAVHRPEPTSSSSASKGASNSGTAIAAKVIPVVPAGKASLVASAAPAARGAVVTAANIAKSEQIAKAAQTPKNSSVKGPSGPRVRAQAVPTASQLAAFERARARRNGKPEPTISLTSVDNSGFTAGAGPAAGMGVSASTLSADGTLTASGSAFKGSTQSLTSLAKIATNKRPLAQHATASGSSSPGKKLFAMGSGLLIVVLVATLSFQMLHGSKESTKPMRQAQVGAQPFGTPSTVLAATSPDQSDEHFTPAPPEQQSPPVQQDTQRPDGPLSEPRAENFDPDGAPSNPPPPPILERPGPMEPPSMGSGPPLEMLPGNQEQE